MGKLASQASLGKKATRAISPCRTVVDFFIFEFLSINKVLLGLAGQMWLFWECLVDMSLLKKKLFLSMV